jgi:hypothetical protein
MGLFSKKILGGFAAILIILFVFAADARAEDWVDNGVRYQLHDFNTHYLIEIMPGGSIPDWNFYLDKSSGITHGYHWGDSIIPDYNTHWCISTQNISKRCVETLNPTITVDENSDRRIVLKVEPSISPQFQPVIYYYVDQNAIWSQYVYTTLEARTLGQPLRDLNFYWEFSNFDLFGNGVYDENIEFYHDGNKIEQPLTEEFSYSKPLDSNYFGVQDPVKGDEFQWHDLYIEGVLTDFDVTLESFEDDFNANPNQGVRVITSYGDIPSHSDFNFTFALFDAPPKSCSLGRWSMAFTLYHPDGYTMIRGADWQLGMEWVPLPPPPGQIGCSTTWEAQEVSGWVEWWPCHLVNNVTCTNVSPAQCYTFVGSAGYAPNERAYRDGAYIAHTGTTQTLRVYGEKGQSSSTAVSIANNAPVVELISPNGGDTNSCVDEMVIDFNWSDPDGVEWQNACGHHRRLNLRLIDGDTYQILENVLLQDPDVYCTFTDGDANTDNNCSWAVNIGCGNIAPDTNYWVDINISDGWLWATDISDSNFDILCPACIVSGLAFPIIIHAARMDAFPWWIYIFIAIAAGVTLYIVGVRPGNK